ncbi:predicted protein, partial [Phaeodactylum tricornutum CCAP 1055/1]
MSTGFGNWNEERKAKENGEAPSNGSSWSLGSDQLLPLFNTESISWDSMKSSMESQMPKKIMGMGYQQRFKVFCALLFLSALFFALAFFIGVPLLVTRPQKFAISFTMGSITFMGSFGILKGPMEHLQSMFAADRLYFSFLYIGSMAMTLYFTFTHGGASGYLLVMAASAVQLVCLFWYLISFLPGGAAGLQYVFAAMGHILKPALVVCAQFQAVCVAKCFGWMT